MRKIRFPKKCLFLLSLLIISLFFLGEIGEAAKLKLRVIVQTPDVRLKPDINSVVIAKIPIGTILESEGKTGSWYKINLPPDENGFVVSGYINQNAVNVIEDIKEVPEKKTFKEPPIAKEEKIEELPIKTPPLPPSPPPSELPRGKVGISFKLSGGMGYSLNGAGDLETVRGGTQDILESIEDLTGYSSIFDWKRLSFIPDFKADIIINFMPNFGIGFGSGLITATSKVRYSIKYEESGNPWWGSWSYETNESSSGDYKITVIPLNFDLYFFLPMGSPGKLNFFGYAGIGYYLGKLTLEGTMKYEEDYEEDDYWYGHYYYDYDETITHTEETKCNTLGFRGGFGLEVKMTPNISFCTELFGRFVNFNNWDGSYTDEWEYTDKSSWYQYSGKGSEGEEGFLWYSEIDTGLDGDLPVIGTSEDKPSGYGVTGVRKAAINLNTFGLLFSIKFRFDIF